MEIGIEEPIELVKEPIELVVCNLVVTGMPKDSEVAQEMYDEFKEFMTAFHVKYRNRVKELGIKWT